MNKTTKNILLVVLLIVIIICSFFTYKSINRNNNSFPNRFNNSQIKSNDENKTTENNKSDEVVNDEEKTTDDNTTTDNNTTDNNTTDNKKQRPSRDSFNKGNRPDNMPEGMPNNMPDNFPSDIDKNSVDFNKRSNNTLGYILFAIENMASGAIIMYLITSNIKKEEKSKK